MARGRTRTRRDAAAPAAAAVAAPGPGVVARVLPAVAAIVAAGAILAPPVRRAWQARRDRRRKRRLHETDSAAALRTAALAPQNAPDSDAVSAAAWQRAIAAAAADAPVDTSDWPVAPLDNELVSTSFQCGPEELLLHLFHPASTYLPAWAARVNVSQLRAEPWTYLDQPGALPWRRDVSYHMPIKQRMGPPMAHTTETQVLRALARNAWTVEVSAQTPNVPLGSTFRTLVKFTARAAADGGTDLHVSGQVKFFSSGLGPLRGMIQSASVEGMRSTYAAVAAELRAAFVAEKPTLPASGLVAPPAQGGKLRPLPQQALVAPEQPEGKVAKRTELLQHSLLVFVLVGLAAAIAQLPFADGGHLRPYLQMAAARLLQVLSGMHAV